MNENEVSPQGPQNAPVPPAAQPVIDNTLQQPTAQPAPAPVAPQAIQQPQPQPVAAAAVPQQQVQQTAPTSQPTPTATTASPEQPTLPPEEKEPKQRRESGIFSFIGTLIAAFALVFIVNTFFFQSYKVFGSSMYPTLHDGDRLIISKVSRTAAKVQRKDYMPKRGDVIVFVDPLDPSLQLIKRVIGLPGERVVVKDGALTVYNEEHPEGFNPDDAEYGKDLPKSSGAADVKVPQGHIFVSGDNREGSNSLDSRNELGTVPEELIIGTLKIRIFPFSTAQFF